VKVSAAVPGGGAGASAKGRWEGRETGLRLFGFVELGVEDDVARREVDAFAVGAAFSGAEFAIHAAVFPFDAERAGVADVVQGADDFFEVDIAATDGLEVPETVGLVEVDMAAEDAGFSGAVAPGDILHVDVEDAIVEFPEKADVVDALVAEVGRIVIESEGGMVVECLEGPFGGGDVEGDFGRMDFQRVFDPEFLELIEDGFEAGGEVFVTGLDLARQDRGERVDEVPDAGAGEAIHDLDAEAGGGLGGFDQFFGGALAHPFGISVAVDVIGQDGLMARVNVVADGLSDEVGGDGKALQSGLVEGLTFGVAVSLVGFGHFEVVAPAGEFNAVVAEGFGFLQDGGERQVGPLAGEEGDWTWHGRFRGVGVAESAVG